MDKEWIYLEKGEIWKKIHRLFIDSEKFSEIEGENETVGNASLAVWGAMDAPVQL